MRLSRGTPSPFSIWMACKTGTLRVGAMSRTAGQGSTRIGIDVADELRAYPIFFHRTFKFGSMGSYFYEWPVMTLVNGLIRMGVYEDNGNKFPGKLCFEVGRALNWTDPEWNEYGWGWLMATITGGFIPSPTKLYWTAHVRNTPSAGGFYGTGFVHGPPVLGYRPSDGNTIQMGYKKTYTYAALPNPFPSDAVFNNTDDALVLGV